MVELIRKKRNGSELSRSEYEIIINGFVSGDIPDYQISAFLMAVYFRGLTNDETVILTDVMMRSGDLIDLSQIQGIKVDKHSTGGVGDKTTLVLAPLVAAAGVPVAKMSGRGLGHTGGTLDKLESIEGLIVDMTKDEFIQQLKKHQIVLCGPNANLVPADKKLYALRDVTGTVRNNALIASSIMSKKLASGTDAMVIDIKVGHGAHMKTLKEAEELGKIMIDIGSKMNRKVIAIISNMNEPLGRAIGNALEVKEAIDTLQGRGPEDLLKICLELGSHMLVLGQIAQDQMEGIAILKEAIASGKAFNKFSEMVVAQGGDMAMIHNPDLLPGSQFEQSYKSKSAGYITELNALDIGLAAVVLGAGRETKDSLIDYGAGIQLKKKIGEYVEKDEELAILYSNNRLNFVKALDYVDRAFNIKSDSPNIKPLILKILQ